MAEPKSPFDKTCSNSWSFSSIIGDEGADRSLENDLDDHNDDELQLQWAAIERLPTRRRLRLSLFKLPEGDHGSMRVVDVTQLEAVERHLFIENLVKNVEKDNKRLLKKFRERIRRYSVVSSSASFFFFTDQAYEGLTRGCGIKSREVEVSILKDVSGILKPARMTLLLGPPGSGKTTLLSSLAGKAIPPLKITGNITYNGFKLEDIVPEKIAAYISQHDLHISQMTVRETLDFAARCQGVGDREDLIREVARREKQAGIIPDPVIDTYMKGISIAGLQTSLQTDYILKILGLDICSETKVGDTMRRGISGGQKRRLTTGEMMVGPTRALFMDEISNGLDSSTTFQIISCIQQLVHIMEATSLISLLQPAAETFNLFDDIILMSEGKIIYHGPRDRVLHFFQDCGFICPKRKGIADFLQEVISEKDQAQYWSNTSIPYRYVTADQFSEKFKFSRTGEKPEEELLELSTKSQDTEIDIAFAAIYLKKWELFKTCMAREFLLMKRDKFVYIAKIVQIMIVAIITMTVFLRMQVTINLEHSSYYVSSFYYTITRIMANGIEELYLSIVRLPVFYKQRDLLFYPAWAYTIPISLLKIPLSLVESFIWTALTYYVIGYAPELQRFFCQFLLLFILHQTSTSLFRFLASITGTAHTSSLLGNLALVISFMFGGFILPKYSFPFWLRWAFLFSPPTYAQIALSLNEFQAPRWQKLSSENMTLGQQILKSQGLDFKNYFYWLSIGALFGFTLLLNIGIALALTYSNNPRNSKATISKQQPSLQKSGEVESKTCGGHIQTNEQIEGRMVIPFKQLTMTFKNVQYFIDTPKEMRDRGFGPKRLQLLQDITGAFRLGVLTALMGVSGAGKTTLMDVLCGRKTGGIIEGDIRIGGYPKIQETFARISGYCEQNDIHSPQITIKESLMFSASLRLPPNVDRQTRADFVDAVLETVELDGLRDALVGIPGINGLSTEQRKRLTIAVELVANPSILFMDEPTSGVDARSAAIVMRAVKNIAEMGRTVICTIHQPSIDIFESFDELRKADVYVQPNVGSTPIHVVDVNDQEIDNVGENIGSREIGNVSDLNLQGLVDNFGTGLNVPILLGLPRLQGVSDGGGRDLAPMHVISYVPVELAPKGIHVNLNEANVGVCDVNKVDVFDSSYGLMFYSSGSALVEPVVMPINVDVANMPLLNIPISLISKDALFAQLDLNTNGTNVDHSDWLEGSISSLCGDDGEELDELVNEMYGLNVGYFLPKAFSCNGGKSVLGFGYYCPLGLGLSFSIYLGGVFSCGCWGCVPLIAFLAGFMFTSLVGILHGRIISL
ncbi:hypothetical protein M5K25_001514 [Dendrobium thyrsiflorum]|uniref:ABC transporter domain-containing protein n=1 Tax=Dendrobium thyrsiflorum TaxID=117978 RepID=A0ABD0VZI7_DENTH